MQFSHQTGCGEPPVGRAHQLRSAEGAFRVVWSAPCMRFTQNGKVMSRGAGVPQVDVN
jgi:hypothetical protein